MNRKQFFQLPLFVLVILILIMGICAMAATDNINPRSPSWLEHGDLMSVIIGSLVSVVLFFMLRTLRKIDANQSRLFTLIDELRVEFYTLRGEHNVMMARCAKQNQSRGLSERPD